MAKKRYTQANELLKQLGDLVGDEPQPIPPVMLPHNQKIKPELTDLDAGVGMPVVEDARPAKKTIEDFLNADLDKLAADYGKHAKGKLGGRLSW